MSEHIRIHWRNEPVEIEYQLIDVDRTDRPLMCFLHEGLGSVSMWRDFPQALCDRADLRGLVYSRPGYGSSTPRRVDERWGVDFLHAQAAEVLPALLDALGIDQAPWLFGHSDGGSIALLHAAMFPARVAGLVLLAPHILAEQVGIDSIERARVAYVDGDLKARLARHHVDVDSAFMGWNDIWLNPAFRTWNITHEIASITCPVLAVQGLGDEYGTLAQIHGIARHAPQTRTLELPDCGHSPHRDQPQAVCDATHAFIQNNSRRPI